MSGRAFIIGTLSVFAIGCVTTQAVYTDPTAEKYAPVSPDSVRIFTAQTELDAYEYVRVAIIEASGSGEYTTQTGMLTAMRKKAGLMGANGILLPAIQEPGAGAKVAGAIFGVGTTRKGNVVAVRVIGPKKFSLRTSSQEGFPLLRLRRVFDWPEHRE